MLVCIKRTCSIQKRTRSKGRNSQLCSLSPLSFLWPRASHPGALVRGEAARGMGRVQDGLPVALGWLLDSAAVGGGYEQLLKAAIA